MEELHRTADEFVSAVKARLNLESSLQFVRTTSISIVGNTPQRAVVADQGRIALIFVSPSGGQCFAWLDNTITTQKGFPVTSTTPVTFSWSSTGRLCQSEWWVTNGTNVTIQVIEVLIQN